MYPDLNLCYAPGLGARAVLDLLGKQISLYLPSKHPIIVIWKNVSQNGRRMGKRVCLYSFLTEVHFQTPRIFSLYKTRGNEKRKWEHEQYKGRGETVLNSPVQRRNKVSLARNAQERYYVSYQFDSAQFSCRPAFVLEVSVWMLAVEEKAKTQN